MAKYAKTKMTKSKKSNLIKSKKLNLPKAKKFNFIKINYFGIDFFTLAAKKAFIHLHKAIIKVSIIQYLDRDYHIYIKTDVSQYAIDKVLSQITLN